MGKTHFGVTQFWAIFNIDCSSDFSKTNMQILLLPIKK